MVSASLCPYLMSILGDCLLQFGKVVIEGDVIKAYWVWLIYETVGGVYYDKVMVGLSPGFKE